MREEERHSFRFTVAIQYILRAGLYNSQCRRCAAPVQHQRSRLQCRLETVHTTQRPQHSSAGYHQTGFLILTQLSQLLLQIIVKFHLKMITFTLRDPAIVLLNNDHICGKSLLHSDFTCDWEDDCQDKTNKNNPR